MFKASTKCGVEARVRALVSWSRVVGSLRLSSFQATSERPASRRKVWIWSARSRTVARSRRRLYRPTKRGGTAPPSAVDMSIGSAIALRAIGCRHRVDRKCRSLCTREASTSNRCAMKPRSNAIARAQEESSSNERAMKRLGSRCGRHVFRRACCAELAKSRRRTTSAVSCETSCERASGTRATTSVHRKRTDLHARARELSCAWHASRSLGELPSPGAGCEHGDD